VNHSGGTTYNAGDNFFPYVDVDDVLSNLDVRLVGPDGAIVHTESRSQEMNLEHIFFGIQDAGQYRIVVEHTGGLQALATYALAWWNGNAPPLPLAGDFNNDGSVNGADYVVWRKLDNSQTGYDEWETNFGSTIGPGGSQTVPEMDGFWITIGLIVGGTCGLGRKLDRRLTARV
jgi:hypothetical protein